MNFEEFRVHLEQVIKKRANKKGKDKQDNKTVFETKGFSDEVPDLVTMDKENEDILNFKIRKINKDGMSGLEEFTIRKEDPRHFAFKPSK